jgi:hypothetical protein
MPTKKELANQFNLSLNTVRKTLEACGLDTAKSEYTDDEIRDRFELARKMLSEEQKGYAEVAAHFGVTVTEDESKDDREYKIPEVNINAPDPIHGAIRENVRNYVQEVTDEAVQDVVAQLPQMIYESAQKVVKSGAIDDVFKQMMERRRAASKDYSFGSRVIDVPAGGLPFVDDDDDEEDSDDQRQWQP